MGCEVNIIFDDMNSERLRTLSAKLDISANQLLMQLVLQALREMEEKTSERNSA